MSIVVRNPPRTNGASVPELARFGVSTIHEAQGRTVLSEPRLRPICPGGHVAGTAVTVSVLARQGLRHVDHPDSNAAVGAPSAEESAR
jgi:regulator of RNase E activity RraA